MICELVNKEVEKTFGFLLLLFLNYSKLSFYIIFINTDNKTTLNSHKVRVAN